jgi:hypothetical protein
MTTTFNLGVSSGTVTSLNAFVDYTSAPLLNAPSGTQNTFSVAPVGYNAEGQGPNLTAAPGPPPVGAITFQFGGLVRASVQPNHQNVQAANNQCGPAAVANSLTWLKTTYGVPIPDRNIPGLRGNPADSLVGRLDLADGRAATSRASGSPLNVLPQLQGKLTYLAGIDVKNLVLKHQGLSPFAGDGFTGARNFTFAGLTSFGQGTIVSPDFIFNEIRKGEDVELGDLRHVMNVIGAGSILGFPFVLYVSDHIQTNGDPMDKLGTNHIDFSFLIPQAGGAQPKFVFGDQDGSSAVNVFTESVPEPRSILLLAFASCALWVAVRTRTSSRGIRAPA